MCTGICITMVSVTVKHAAAFQMANSDRSNPISYRHYIVTFVKNTDCKLLAYFTKQEVMSMQFGY